MRVCFGAGCTFTLAALSAFVLRQLPVTVQPLQAMAALAVYPMLLAPLAVIVFLVCRTWILASLAFLVAAACVVVEGPLFVGETAPRQGARLVVMTSNLRLGDADPSSVLRRVSDSQVDVLMTEELTEAEAKRLASVGLGVVLPYHELATGAGASGVGIWSRYRLEDPQRLSGLNFNAEAAVIDVPNVSTSPTVVVVHLAGPWPGPATAWDHDVTTLPSIFKNLAATRPTAAILVGGDFNATFDNEQFRHLLTGGYHDAAEQAGAGLIRTYPADTWYPPVVGIDHVVTRHAVGTSVRALGIRGSDHEAVLASIVLNTP
jgi:endonuclease/exonuclease/phosphatase (EEP) superfamily protein YafD